RLLGAMAAPEEDPALFDGVAHLARGAALLDAGETKRLAQLALAAGRRAAGSAGFESAWQFFESGLHALGGRDDYDLWRALCAGSLEAAFVAGRRESMEARIA